MRRRDIRAEIAYHDYAVLIAHIDAERFFRSWGKGERSVDVFAEPNDNLAKECAKYRRDLRRYWSEFRNLNGVEGGASFDQFLFNPACFIAFGNNDNIAILAGDDFDMIERLASSERSGIRQTCLAFAPKLKSLGISGNGEKQIFCELDEICRPPEAELEDKHIEKLLCGGESDGEVKAIEERLTYGDIEKRTVTLEDKDINKLIEKLKAPALPFLRGCPLLAVTYYKLSGMAVLGPGLLMQQAVYKAMAGTIRDILEVLRKKTDRKTGDERYKRIMSDKDVDSFRCAFLDPQGWSDIVTLMFCRNYSVIATVLVALRCITLERLYKTSGGEELKKAVDDFKIHQIMSSAAKNEKEIKNPPDRWLSKNHAFCSTFTTVGIGHEAFRQGSLSGANNNYNGESVVIADTNLNLCCGHVRDMIEGTEKEKKYTAKFNNEKSGYAWYTMGHSDCLYQELIHEDLDARQAVKLFELVQQIKHMRDCPVQAPYDKTEPRLASHILEASSILRIPIPVSPREEQTWDELEIRKIAKGHFELRYALEELRRGLFEPTAEGEVKEGEPPKNLSINVLHNRLKELRVPAPLYSSVTYLYGDFANYLSDSFLFDSVVDLYDIFATVYRLLTVTLPGSLRRRLEDEQRMGVDTVCRNFLSAEDVENLVKLVELMQCALAHRVQVAFREAERWNITVDVRGLGLDRILNAADGPLKCCLGVLRRVMKGRTRAYVLRDYDTEDKRSKIGGACKLSQNPRSLSERLVVGRPHDVFLASVDLNIAHLTRPRAFYIHFHEAGHLVCQLLRMAGCKHREYDCYFAGLCCHKSERKPPWNEYCETVRERYEEIFVETLVHQFLFGSDYKLYLRNYVANWSLDPMAYCKDDEDTFLRMFEVLIRGFLITEPFRAEVKREELYSGKKNAGLLVKGAYNRFLKAVEEAGPFFLEFERLWYECNNQKNIPVFFEGVYKEAYQPMCCIWDDVKKIYEDLTEGVDPRMEQQEELVRNIQEGLGSGRPLVRILYPKRGANEASGERSRLDPFFLIRHVIKEHIRGFFGEEVIDPQKHVLFVPRDSKGEPVKIELPEGKKLHEQLLDRRLNDVVSVSPETRKKFMRNRITVIKTLWDISTNLRARRMKELLKSSWPELKQTE